MIFIVFLNAGFRQNDGFVPFYDFFIIPLGPPATPEPILQPSK